MQRGQEVVLECGPMVHGGLCLAHLEDGTTVFVAAAIPGETVHAKLDYRRRQVWFATAAEVLQSSPHRVEAPCPYYGQCGGCQLQHVEYGEQLRLKEEIVRDAMRRAAVPLPETLEVCAAADPWNYRRRGEFHVIPGPAGMRDAELGFNRARSWKPIAIADCLIHHPQIRENLSALRQAVRDGGDASLTALHLTVGEDGEELLLRAKPQSALAPAAVEAAAASAAARGRWSTEATTLKWRDALFRVTPESFIQVNWDQLDALYGTVLQELGDVSGCTIVDAYGGIGVMAVVLAQMGAKVICIESNRSAVRMGNLNARLNGVEHAITYVCEPVEKALAHFRGAAAVILDPPRAGCASAVPAWLALSGPQRVIYVSCEPSTLARDLRLLAGSGPYAVERLVLVDLFPQTHHIESVAVLGRASLATPGPDPAGARV